MLTMCQFFRTFIAFSSFWLHYQSADHRRLRGIMETTAVNPDYAAAWATVVMACPHGLYQNLS